MYLDIYNNIIHGSLNPQNGQVPDNYSEISYLLDNCPDSLHEVESRLLKILGKNSQINFNSDTPVSITQYLNNQVYTHISIDYFAPEIKLPMHIAQTPMQRFYYFVITAEAKRIKLRLLQSVEILKDDICTKQEIKDVLTLLAHYAKNIQEQQPNDIFNFLLVQIVKLYFELTLIFDILLTEQDYLSFSDFYSLRLNRQTNEVESTTYLKTLHIHQAQQIFCPFSSTKAQNLLSQLYADLEKTPTDNTLITVICALENAMFLQTENVAIPAFAELVDNNFLKSILKDRKQIFYKQLSVSNPHEALAIIENIAENLPDFSTVTPEIVKLLTLSVTRQLRDWLAEQKEIFKNQITITNMIDKNAVSQNIYAGVVATGDNAVVNTNKSTIVGGQNNTVSLSNDLRKEIENIIPQIIAIANVLSDEQEEIIAELQRINAQLNKKQPKSSVIGSAFQTIYTVLCGVTGNIVTPFVLEKMQVIVKALEF